MEIMKKELSKREIVFVSIFAVAALIFAYLNYFIFPSYIRIAELKTELVQKKQIVANRDEAQKRLELMDSLLEENKTELENIEKKIPYSVKLPELIVNIDSKIYGLNMDIRSIAVGEPDTANKEYDTIPVKVSIDGKYDNIIAFIKYIEDNERKFIIDSFALAPVKRAEAMPFDISMRTFVLKDAQGTGSTEPEDYYFFRHDNGKEYPFLEGGKKTYKPDRDIIYDIEEMENKFDKLDDIIDGFKGIVPNIGGIGED